MGRGQATSWAWKSNRHTAGGKGLSSVRPGEKPCLWWDLTPNLFLRKESTCRLSTWFRWHHGKWYNYYFYTLSLGIVFFLFFFLGEGLVGRAAPMSSGLSFQFSFFLPVFSQTGLVAVMYHTLIPGILYDLSYLFGIIMSFLSCRLKLQIIV